MKELPTTLGLTVLAILVIVTFMGPTVFGQATTSIETKPLIDHITAAKVDKLFAQWDKPGSPGCSLGVSKNSVLVYERGYGMADLELGVPNTPKSVFHVASTTKMFTAMAIMVLVTKGLVSLDDPVRKYITELPDYGTPITIRHLLNHTSGLRNAFTLRDLGEPREDGDELDRLVKILSKQKSLNAAPGTEFLYLNAGYAMLAVIVKRVSGQTLHSFGDTNIFKPLGMANTHFHDDRTKIVPNRTSGYYLDSSGTLHLAIEEWTVTYNPKNHGNIGNGMAGLFTTVQDLMKWEHNFAAAKVGDHKLFTAMEAPTVLANGDRLSYGFGLQLTPYRGLRTIGHSGGDPGYSANVVRFPDHGLAVAVLCNFQHIDSVGLSQRVADIYLSDQFPSPALNSPAAAPVALTLSQEQLQSKVGLYRDRSNDNLKRVFLREGKLLANDGREGNAGVPMTAVSSDRFVLLGNVFWEIVPTSSGDQEIREQKDPAVAHPGYTFGAEVRFAPGQKPLVFQREKTFEPSAQELNAYAGVYASSELDTNYTLAAQGLNLIVQRRGRSETLLRPIFTDAFRGSPIGLLKFERDSRGVITGFVLKSNRIHALRFDRVKP